MPTPEELFARALLAGTHAPEAIAAEFGETGEAPVDLTGRTAAELEGLRGHRVVPAPGVAEYLASGDEITHEILDAAEQATERHYGLAAPWFIASHRSASDGVPVAHYFYLDREE